jgi:N-acetyl-gamma-glutamyl-phosphate reductase
MLKVAICGASGYTGAELLRLLAGHPRVKVAAVTSEKSEGKSPADIYGHLRDFSRLRFERLDRKRLLAKADLFFMALPHGASQEAVDYFYRQGRKVIDLSADYRLKNHLIYERWYKAPHRFEATLRASVYGLPEIYRGKLRKARLAAVPGCYPTSAILGLYPALKDGLVDAGSIIIDSKSGTTGAGRKAELAFSFSEVNEDFRAYAVASHRHTPEIDQELSSIAAAPVNVNFTPHLLPLDRGILSTVYGRLKKRADADSVYSLYKKAYGKEPFVRVLPPGALPGVKDVRGTNVCAIGLGVNKDTSTLIVVAAIDNLVKGASGQAVQCMNIMMGFKETTALGTTALCP